MPTLIHTTPTSTARLARVLVLCASLCLVGPAHATIQVVTTTSDLAALVSEVGGDAVSVKALAAADQDPHYVDPRPSLVVALARADLLIVNGLGLEIGWLPPLQVNARNAAVQVGGAGYFDASKHVRLLEVSHSADRAMGDIHPGGNPHFLFDPRAGALLAKAIGERLVTLAPESARDFRANARRVASELGALAVQESKRFKALGPDKLRAVTYHRSLVYLLDWLGIARPINVEPKPGVAPSPSHVAKVLATMRSQQIRTILQERFYPTKTSKTLARLAKGQVVILSGGTNFRAGERYIERLQKIAGAIHVALSR
ncbi:MAG: metal ABC transporter substrate-binding protein [Myxococcota bacterium]|nr:metal ABC transporter substrate-binding protein [Myxococcota bacterium]